MEKPRNFIKTELIINPLVKERMMNVISVQDLIHDYRQGYNWPVRDMQDGAFKNLYWQMIELAKKSFQPFHLRTNNTDQCFAAVTSGNNFRAKLHAHLANNCVVNAVYYLQMPKNISGDEGGLVLVEDGKQFVFRPEENDLIFMPFWMEHKPLYHASEELRVALNMEIRSEELVEHFFEKKK